MLFHQLIMELDKDNEKNLSMIISNGKGTNNTSKEARDVKNLNQLMPFIATHNKLEEIEVAVVVHLQRKDTILLCLEWLSIEMLQ